MANPGLRRTPLSASRFLLVGLPVFFLSLADLYVLNVFGVTTVAELVARTVVYTVGMYIGVTVLAYTIPPGWPRTE